MKNRIIIAAAFAACLALCAIVWPQTERGEEIPAPNETTAVTTPQPTLQEPEELILSAIIERQESEMSEDEPETEQKSAPPMQTDSAPVEPTQSEPEPLPKSEPMVNDNELVDMVYVPGFGWIQSEGPNHVEYAEDMYENGNKIGIMG